MKLTAWHSEATDLQEKLGLTKAKIAAKAGMTAMSLGRYLSGKRKPSTKQRERINRVIGELAEMPEVEFYLDAVSLVERVGEKVSSANAAALVGEALRAGGGADLFSLDEFFREGWLAALLRLIPDSEGSPRRFAAAVILERRKHLVRRIRGSGAEQTFLAGVLTLSDVYGIPLRGWLRPDAEERDGQRKFYMAVDRALATTDLKVSERARVARSIIASYLVNKKILDHQAGPNASPGKKEKS